MKFVRLLNDQGRLYDSYTDYWSLVNLSGFATCGVEEIDRDSNETYILSPPNGNAQAIVAPPHRCKFVCWQLERPLSGFDGYAPPGYDAVWVSDLWVADKLREDPRVRYVSIGGHPALGGLRGAGPWPLDFTHQAYVYGRRARIVGGLVAQGWRIGNACWGTNRDLQLSTSRWGLCLHQDELPVIEPLRYTLFGCWGLPLVAEKSRCAWPYRVYGLDEIHEAVDGETNYQLLTQDLTFRKCVERGLADSRLAA